MQSKLINTTKTTTATLYNGIQTNSNHFKLIRSKQKIREFTVKIETEGEKNYMDKIIIIFSPCSVIHHIKISYHVHSMGHAHRVYIDEIIKDEKGIR